MGHAVVFRRERPQQNVCAADAGQHFAPIHLKLQNAAQFAQSRADPRLTQDVPGIFEFHEIRPDKSEHRGAPQHRQ